MANSSTSIPVEEEEGKCMCVTEDLESNKETTEKTASENKVEDINGNLFEENDKLESRIFTSITKSNVRPTPQENVTFSFSRSQDKLTCTIKKNQRTNKRGEAHESFPLLTKLVVKSFLSQSSMRDCQSNQKLYEIYPNPDKLCDDCRWLVKATKSSESTKSSSEDEEFVTKWVESRTNIRISKDNKVSGKKSTEVFAKESKKEDVMKLFGEVHSSLLECNILLTTQKLNTKFRKAVKEDEGTSEMSLSDDLFDQIQAEEDSKDGTSKLCIVLENLVTKYIKCIER